MKYTTVFIKKSIVDAQTVEVPAHEVKILRLIHGDSNITVGDSREVKTKGKEEGEPDLVQEAERLTRKYPGETGKEPWFLRAYGPGEDEAMARLAAAMGIKVAENLAA